MDPQNFNKPLLKSSEILRAAVLPQWASSTYIYIYIYIYNLSPGSRYFTTWNGFAVSKSPRIQSSILKVMDVLTVYERFLFVLSDLFFPFV